MSFIEMSQLVKLESSAYTRSLSSSISSLSAPWEPRSEFNAYSISGATYCAFFCSALIASSMAPFFSVNTS
jgi:hypothetical protein